MAVTETGRVAAHELDSLYRRHGAQIYRYALAVLGNHPDAEDVTQTTFLNAYRSLEQGVRPRKASNWLLTIASNVIKQRFRQEQTRPRHVALDREVAGASPQDDDGPTVGELLTALSQIPPQQRQAIVLREFEGRSYGEITDILGITTTALETLLFRARRSLAEELVQRLTCTDAQQAISRAADGRIGRKERRRLREHLGECPDCAQFARLQQRHRRALRGLALVPVPVSLTLLKGLEGSAAAAVLPTAAGTAGAAVAAAGSGGVSAGATGGGIFAGGLAAKAAAVVAVASVAGGASVVGVQQIQQRTGTDEPPAARTTKSGKSVPVRNHGTTASERAKERRKAIARGRTGQVPPGRLREPGSSAPRSSRGNADEAKAKASERKAVAGTSGAGKASGSASPGGDRTSKADRSPNRGSLDGALFKAKRSGTKGSQATDELP